jgi:diguanylate cyclase (GGDEF)-like protein
MRFFEKNKSLKAVGLALVVSACLTLPAIFIYQSAKGLIVGELNKSAINIAATAASFLEQDIEAYKSLPTGGDAEAGSYDKDYYAMLLRHFEKIERVSGAANVFTEKRMPDKSSVFMIDGSVSRHKGPALGTPRDMLPEERRAFSEGTVTQSGLMWDETRGEFITGYAPVIDSETGEAVGIVGVEFPLRYAQSLTNGIGNIIIISFLVIAALMTFVVYSLSVSRRRYFREDYMTGLFNKRFFERDLAKVMRYSRKNGRKMTLIMLDVDCFKTINDTMGHTMGDAVLKAVARRMQIHLRSSDLCCRFGGDEFVITLINTDPAQAFVIAERIRREIMSIELYTETGEAIDISCSIGIAEFDGCQSSEELIECADKAMYVSKNSGKNRTTIYSGVQAA